MYIYFNARRGHMNEFRLQVRYMYQYQYAYCQLPAASSGHAACDRDIHYYMMFAFTYYAYFYLLQEL